VKKERHGLEIVMPITRAPEWLDYSCIGGNPCFWVRGKFLNVALAFVFQDVIKKKRKSRRLLVELHLVINGQCVPRKGYYNFRIEPNHVLVCDLRLLFNDEEWLGLDALFLKHEWNQVQVSYEASSSVTIGAWGVYVYKQGTTNMEEHVQFTCPDPTRYSNIANTIVPTKDPLKEQIMMIEELALDEMLNGSLAESMNMEDEIVDKFQDQLTMLGELSKEVNDALKGKPWMLRTIKESYDDDDDENEPPTPNLNHKDELIKPPMDAYVGETSTSGHKRSLEAQAQEIMMKIFLSGMRAGLCEAQSSFPSLDIDTTMVAAFTRGKWISLSLLRSEVGMKTYIEGIFNGLREAKLSFPTLDLEATANNVLSKTNINGYMPAPTTMVWGPDCGSVARRWRGAPYLSLLRGDMVKPTTSSSYRMRCRSSYSISHAYYTCQSPMNLRTLQSQETRRASICLISSGARIHKNLRSGTLPKVHMCASPGYTRSTRQNWCVEKPVGIVQQEHFSGIRIRVPPFL
jgi:hypothetical protein